MEVENVPLATVGGWDHIGLVVGGKADVTDEAFVENAIRCVAVVDGQLGFAGNTRARSVHGWCMVTGTGKTSEDSLHHQRREHQGHLIRQTTG